MAVYRWWQPDDQDWISVADGSNDPSMAKMQSLGFVWQSAIQFYVPLIGTDPVSQVAVFRWWHPVDRDWVTIPEGSISDAQMLAWGYDPSKVFQFYAWRTNPPGAGRIAVYRWWQPADKDWITLVDGEISDAQMAAWGYVSKTFLFYAYPARSGLGYFTLGSPTTVLQKSGWESTPPHTLSVVEANAGGFKYWGYYGLQGDCGGVGLARSNDLVTWTKNLNPLFSGHERWSSVVLSGGVFNMVHDVNGCPGGRSVVFRTSADGMTFTAPTTVIPEETNTWLQNATLFKHPTNGFFYLYWLRAPNSGASCEIWVKSASTLQGLVSATAKRIAFTPPDGTTRSAIVAAPQMMFRNGTYYLATETLELYWENGGDWRTRILTSSAADGEFSEVAANPVLSNGSACFFQHVFDNKLHGFYCKVTPDITGTWTVDKRSEP